MNVMTEQHVHCGAARMELPQLVRSRQDAVGQRLTAVLTGLNDAKAVGEWAKGERLPHPEAERRLRDAFWIVQLLLQSESAETVRAWLVGMNPDLHDQSPALTFRENPQEVLQAARRFGAGA